LESGQRLDSPDPSREVRTFRADPIETDSLGHRRAV
jgi:hypothetical protein